MKVIKEYQKTLEGAKDLKEFKTIAEALILYVLGRGRFLAYALSGILYSAYVRNGYSEDSDSAFDFSQKVKRSELCDCPQSLRMRMINRMFRRANPKFTIPQIQNKKRRQRKKTDLQKKWKINHTTSDPAVKACVIADREAEIIWRQSGDWNRWSKAWLEIYSSALSEFCYQ